MNNPNIPVNSSGPFNYDPTAYDASFFSSLSLHNNANAPIDPNANQMAANFYNHGFYGFGDPLNFHNFGYFNHPNPNPHFPTPAVSSISLTSPSLTTQTPTLYHQANINNNRQIKSSTPNRDALRVSHANNSRSGGSDQSPTNHPRGKTKRKRILFSSEQVRIMEEHFMISQNTQHSDRQTLSKMIGLSPQQIKIWYQNRRYKEKQTRRELDKCSAKNQRHSNPDPIPNQPVKDVKLDFKQEVDNQIMAMQNTGSADGFPTLYPHWQSGPQSTPPLFPFNAEMYANGFPNLQPTNALPGYPPVFPDFNNPNNMNPLNLTYYNPSTGPPNPS